MSSVTDSLGIKAIGPTLASAAYRGLWRLCSVYGRVQPPSRRLSGDARRVLERVIFPAVYADPTVKTILFVGVGPYTSWYPRLFHTRPRMSFRTIDSDPQVARWGARERHRIIRLEALANEAASRDAHDLIVANGIFGFGTDSDEANAAVLDACYALLRPGGRLLVGYSKPGTFDPDLVDSSRFQPTRVPGFAVERYLTRNENRHSFVCFAKVQAERSRTLDDET